ncbi:MAG: plasma membrane localization protein [Alectoria sarmentosa]|nr:MAG: plasma membrane localization protein [Alectoria sarmentosa]CAD6592006.1 MAG: plasma membrane localization protein [Alectoria sarmentosa]
MFAAHAVRQKCRPKHQVLILKCYPAFQKTVLDMKPNSSELSYLLYYASTRRSKLQKVGDFLEKKAVSDVSKGKIGNVQVTLKILQALIEKLPRDLPLYAPYILRILGTVLRSKDLSMVEESVPTFEAFCEHQDVATLAADQQHIGRYEDIVRTYASYAALKTPVQPKGGLTAPIAIRWRSAGLRAVKSITSSEAVGADGGRQMNIVMPVILQNLQSGDEEHLRELQRKVEEVETKDEKQALRRRMSIATVQTADGSSRPNSGAIIGTADDADRLAEEEVGLQALRSFKQIFMANNRAQIRLATGAMLKFICTVPQRRPGMSNSTRSVHNGSWATTLMEMCTRWAPVQDRFVILVTVMETLVRSPIAEENMEQQLLLVSLVGWLLRSNINMIGLSVMDVLLGLVQHILLLLQLGGKGSNVLPHHQQTDAIDLFKGTEDLIDGPASHGKGETNGTKAEESLPSSNRQELLSRLHRCIGDLATHVYYSDQISDMITAILLRLKPSPMSGVATAAAAIEDPQAAARAIQASVHLQENPDTDEFFSFGTARVTALKAIKEVLTVANMKGTINGGAAIGRNRVGVQIWEGTQWLIRDEDRRVRRAYVDALLTWLRLEMSSNDLRVLEDKRKLLRTPSKADVNSSRRDTMIRRAVSTASRSEKTSKPAKSTFLQLLHLAIYDNAIEAPESGSDLLLIHLLLVRLVEKLGVNAVKTGLPMIMRLQEDINVDELISTPIAKLNIGSLVHGYFWTLCDKFDFDTSHVGFAVRSEISRRKQHGLWLDAIQVPPLPLEQIMSAASRPLSEKIPLPLLQTESLKPFDSRPAMVDRIAESYASTVASPPTSPPASPGRVFILPPISSQGLASTSSNGITHELPPRIVDVMLSDWSKELCIANVEKESTRTISLNSRNGTNLSKYLGVNGQSPRGISPNGDRSAVHTRSLPNENDISQPQALNFAFQNQQRRSSAHDTGSPTPISSSDQNTTLRVDDLKRVLAGGTLNVRGASPLRSSTARHEFTPSENNGHRSISSSSESVVSVEGFESASEGDLARPLPPPAPNPLAETTPSNPPAPVSNHAASSTHSRTSWVTHPRSRPQSGEMSPGKSSTPRSLRRPSTSSSGEDPNANAAALRGEIVHPRLSGEEFVEDEVPPVPPLPANVTAFPTRPLSVGIPPMQPQQQHQAREPLPNEVKQSKHASIGRKRGVDVHALLGSIDAVSVGERRRIGGGVGRPPY